MAQYRVNQRYKAKRDGLTFGPYEPDTTVELADADAEWIERDSPGTLTPLEETVPADGEAKPGKDRAHRGGRNRGAA